MGVLVVGGGVVFGGLVGVVGSGVGNALVGTTTGTVGRRTGARVGVGVGVGVADGLGDSEVSVALGLEELRVGLGVWLAVDPGLSPIMRSPPTLGHCG
ncbi:MAG: hypothetical protein LCH60_00135 [Actinobacteria bacterium]|nr:hypothetical protein [Actinomycetota bacterium]